VHDVHDVTDRFHYLPGRSPAPAPARRSRPPRRNRIDQSTVSWFTVRLRHVVLTKNDRVSSRRGPRVGYDCAIARFLGTFPARIVAVGERKRARERERERQQEDRDRAARAVNSLRICGKVPRRLRDATRTRKCADEESDFSRGSARNIPRRARARFPTSRGGPPSVRPSVLAAPLHNRELSYLMLQHARPVS